MITIERWARGAVLALAATLAFASAGCQTSSDSDSDEDVASIEQELDPVVEGQDDQGEEGVLLPGCDCEAGDENKDPQPQPWRNAVTSSPGQSGPDPVDPVTKTSVAPPTGGGNR